MQFSKGARREGSQLNKHRKSLSFSYDQAEEYIPIFVLKHTLRRLGLAWDQLSTSLELLQQKRKWGGVARGLEMSRLPS